VRPRPQSRNVIELRAARVRHYRRYWAARYARPSVGLAVAVVGLAISYLIVSQLTPHPGERIGAKRPASAAIEGFVQRVIDGDTLVIAGTTIRLGDFDAPEMDEDGGQTATKALGILVRGLRLSCTPCEGARTSSCMTFGRTIATCRIAGHRVGDLLRQQGVREGGR
jgi:endonuclease YncB( thermonuclease family)